MKRLFPLLFLLACGAVATAQPAPAPSRGTPDWLRLLNRATNEELSRSPNKGAVETMIRAAFDKPRAAQKLILNENSLLRLIDRGLGRPEEIVLIEKGRPDRVVFSNATLARNNLHHLIGFSVSADRRFLAVVSEARGSTDDYALRVLDFATGREVLPTIAIRGSTVLWNGDRQILFMQNGPRNAWDRVIRLDVTAPQKALSNNPGYLLPGRDGWGLLRDGNTGAWLALHDSGKIHPIGKPGNVPNLVQLIGQRGNDLVLRAEGGRAQVQLLTAPLDGGGGFSNFYLRDHQPINWASLKGGFLITEFQWGAERALLIFNAAGTVVHELAVPNCCSVSSIEWAVPGEKLQIEFRSEIRKEGTFIYDLKRSRWENPRLEAEMMSVDGVDFVTEIVTVISADHRKVPMRLTRRQDAPKDGRRPVYIESYGGFATTGAINPAHDPIIADFLRRGGLHAAPALRGGNEFGYKWWQDGRGKNKEKTLEDLIASADWLIKNGWTRGDRIVSAGASNGGLVVTAAALKSPGSFGLVIPSAGVHDVTARPELDPEFLWYGEYGDPSKPYDLSWMRSFSPVDLAKKLKTLSTKFLIIVGRDDSRVNPDHSYRLVETMLARGFPPEKVRLVDLKNAGHWAGSISYQDLIGWRSEAVRWTMIYDHLGIGVAP